MLDGSGRLSEELDAMTRNSDVTSVSNNSWGNLDRPWPKRASLLWEQAIYNGITNGNDRQGHVLRLQRRATVTCWATTPTWTNTRTTTA